MSSETTQSQTAFYRYPPRGLLGDYVRSAVGLALGIALLAGSEGSPWVLAISTTLVLAFGAFLVMFASTVVVERNLRKMGRVGLEKVAGSVRNRQGSQGLGGISDRMRNRFKRGDE